MKANYTKWQSTKQYVPNVRALVKMADGSDIWAIRAMGEWETDSGEVLYPISFKLPEVVLFSVAQGHNTERSL